MLINQGENIKFIQHQLGHSSIKTTLDRYGHLIPEVHTETAKRLDETLFSQNHISKTLAEKRNKPKEKMTCNNQDTRELGSSMEPASGLEPLTW